MDNNPYNHQDCKDLVSDNNFCSNDTEYEPEYETEVITITNDVSLEILSVVREFIFMPFVLYFVDFSMICMIFLLIYML